MKAKTLLLAVVFACMTGTSALASKANPSTDPTNEPPPAGAILDLNGTPIPGGGNGSTFQQYTVSFNANIANTAITFAFRDDPAFLSFEDASVTDLTTSSGNLLMNGDFSGGVHTDNGNSATPNGWTYANIFGAAFGGVVDAPCLPTTGPTADCWFDAALQAYDAISQTIPTTVGDNYQISFFLSEDSNCSTNGGPPCNFSDLSTNGDVTDQGGNGIDVLAYAQAGLPSLPTPEPGTMVLFGIGLLFGVETLRRRLRRA